MPKQKKEAKLKQMGKKNDPQRKPHYKGLTFKEGRLVDEFVRQAVEDGDLNKTKAVQKVYDAKPATAAVMGTRLLGRDKIRQAFLTELDSLGLTDERNIQAHTAALQAIKRRRDTETGEVWEEPDHNIRLRAVDLFYKVKGLYPDRHTSVDMREQRFHLYANMTPQELEKAEAEIVERVKRLEAASEDAGGEQQGAGDKA